MRRAEEAKLRSGKMPLVGWGVLMPGVLFVAAVTDGGPARGSSAVMAVSVSPATATIVVHATQQFTATAQDALGNPVACAFGWASSNTLVAQVDQNGVATGITQGSATITASCGIESGSASLTVNPEPATPLVALGSVPVPEPPNLGDFVRNRAAAVQLGKALFWDMQAGGDGVQACASCHFHAGADNRRKNQLSPGLLAGDVTFQVGGPNYTLQPKDFPFTKHVDENDPNSPIVQDANDVASSQGVFLTKFQDVFPPNPADICQHVRDVVFNVGGITTRRVEPRNTPTTVNAVFNFRNFWDGRANNNFNGVNPFGQRDTSAKVWRADAAGNLTAVQVVIPIGSLASQSVGPPGSPFEMSCDGRFFAKIGKKLLDPGVVPLAQQRVHPQDGVLGAFARGSGTPGSTGLTVSYATMVQDAFLPQWWSSPQLVTINGQQFRQIEANFSLFWGLAVQLYETTLIADNTRLDQFLTGNTAALTALEQQGKDIFTGKGRCANCHGGAELTNASVRNVSNQRLERMIVGDGGCAIYDNGFYNIGVRPTNNDLGVGGTDPFGNPLSETRMAMQGKFVDATLRPPLGSVPGCDARANVDGAFKAPSLRNVELTGPYFQNGGKATLAQVVDFYNRGGDFSVPNLHQLDPDIQPLGLTIAEKAALVAFLQALTDERVRQESAPFDHPQLFRPQGHPGDDKKVNADCSPPSNCVDAQDDLFEVTAIGAGGRPAEGLVPLQPFMTVSQMTGSGQIGTGRATVNFGFKFRVVPNSQAAVRVRDQTSNLNIDSDSLSNAFTTETCVRLTGTARVNGATGYSYVARGCDNRQPGAGLDTFEITVTGPAGFTYTRSGVLTGGNLESHIH